MKTSPLLEEIKQLRLRSEKAERQRNAVVILLRAKCTDAEWQAYPQELQGCVDAEVARLRRGHEECIRRLDEAEKLLERGIAAMNRVGWEPGETDQEWCSAAGSWVSHERLERAIFERPVQAADAHE